MFTRGLIAKKNWEGYKINKPLSGISADNVLGWEIALKISHLPSKLRFLAKCSSLSSGHYQPIYQPPEGVYLLNISQFLKPMDNKHNSLNLAAKICSDICPWILSVPRSSSFPRASLSKNCSLLGTDNVRGQISEHIFAPNEGYCLFIFSLV